MIPILYESTEESFVYNGICRLPDCLSCVVTEERNGSYECDFEYPINGANYKKIQCGRIIGVTHDDTQDIQPFDIVSYSRPIKGIVLFHAVHISYRQAEMVVRGTGINGISSAFALLKTATPSNPFTYVTDIISDHYMAAADNVPRTVRQMLGGIEGSILDSYGGEYEWDKFTVRLLKSRGEKKDFSIRYGKNLRDYTEDADYFGTYTSAVPYWVGDDGAGGQTVVVGNRVDTGFTSYNDRNICVPMDLTDKFEVKPTAAQLQSFALSQMTSGNVNMPHQNIKVDFLKEDSDLSQLKECKICDTISVIFPRYSMQGLFKIVRTEFDVLRGRYKSMELGDLSVSLSEALGIPTSDLITEREGTAVEHGSNSNGEYWKFPDGLQICTKKYTGTVTMTTSWQGHYETASAINFGNWARSFVAVPTVTSTCVGGNALAILERLQNTSTSAVGTSYLMSPASRSNISVGFHFIAIGRWK